MSSGGPKEVGQQVGLEPRGGFRPDVADLLVEGGVRLSLEFAKSLPLFGPLFATAEQLLSGRLDRLKRVEEKAQRKAQGRQPTASERTKWAVLDEALRTDDELVAEYLGGVIAAEGAESDRGVYMANLVGSLDSLQLRVHFVVYRELAFLVQEATRRGRELDLRSSSLLPSLGVSLPTVGLVASLGFTPSEGALNGMDPRDQVRFEQAGLSLASMGLVSGINERPGFEVQVFRDPESNVEVRGSLVAPTRLGIELFLWGIGHPDHDPAALVTVGHDQMAIEPDIPLTRGFLSGL